MECVVTVTRDMLKGVATHGGPEEWPVNPTGRGEDHYYSLKPNLKQTLITY